MGRLIPRAVLLDALGTLLELEPPAPLLVRAGILPDPSNFSTVQYQKILSDTNMFWYQWVFFGLLVVAGLVLIGAVLALRGRQIFVGHEIGPPGMQRSQGVGRQIGRTAVAKQRFTACERRKAPIGVLQLEQPTNPSRGGR